MNHMCSIIKYMDQVRLTASSKYAGVACDNNFKWYIENNMTDIYISSCILITL